MWIPKDINGKISIEVDGYGGRGERCTTSVKSLGQRGSGKEEQIGKDEKKTWNR